MSNLLNEMKRNSGVKLNEAEISQIKTMNAESRLIGAFGGLLRELQFIQTDAERYPRYYGGDQMSNSEKEERDKIVDMPRLYKIALSKLEIVKNEITKTFKEEMSETDEEEKAEHDDDDEEDDDEL